MIIWISGNTGSGKTYAMHALPNKFLPHTLPCSPLKHLSHICGISIRSTSFPILNVNLLNYFSRLKPIDSIPHYSAFTFIL